MPYQLSARRTGTFDGDAFERAAAFLNKLDVFGGAHTVSPVSCMACYWKEVDPFPSSSHLGTALTSVTPARRGKTNMGGDGCCWEDGHEGNLGCGSAACDKDVVPAPDIYLQRTMQRAAGCKAVLGLFKTHVLGIRDGARCCADRTRSQLCHRLT